jgi:hypothetical protein|tara:strand:- start:903 stop:1124 length:222 start_codon:yes stop_codon:yes gene_type:complete
MSQSDKETVDFEIANWLALEDLAKLIEINRDRICVFNEGTATVDSLSMLNPVIMNGTSIQITVNDDLDEPIKF